MIRSLSSRLVGNCSKIVDMCPELVDMCPELVEGLLIGPSTDSGRMSLRPELVLLVFEEPLGEPPSGGVGSGSGSSSRS